MLLKKVNMKNMKTIWALIFILLMMSGETLAQGGVGTEETLGLETPPADLGSGEGVNVPLNTDEWILVLSGLSLGVYRMYRVWIQYRR
jgi:hypothetical protein